MSGLIGKINLILMVTIVALMGVACGPAAGPDPQKDVSGESLAVPQATAAATAMPEVTPTNTVVPTPAVQAASPLATPVTELSTEITEPVSPISPTVAEETTMQQNPASRAIAPAPGSDAAVAAAIADLTKQKGIPADAITVKSAEAKEWGDTSLGCPQEGFMYAQVITPGYLIILEAQGQSYEYHTDEQGKNVVLCEK